MYNIDPSTVTVSGFSAGGYMSAQLGIAYSSIFSGFGVLAGGPYDCARDQDFFNMCEGNHTPAIDLPIAHIRQWSAENRIDSVNNLRAKTAWLYTGALDVSIGPAVMRQLEKQLQVFIPSERMRFVELPNAGHVFPTDTVYSDLPTSRCSESASPNIANCGYDGVGEMFKWLYGNINPRIHGSLTGTLHSYAQTGTLGAIGLADHGYYYVPSSCASMARCKLHVALHGCTTSPSGIAERFITSTGYLQYADTNDMIILVPQGGKDDTSRPIWYKGGTAYPGASFACFDFVGWSGGDADWRSGVQMQAIVKMVGFLMGK